MFSKACQYAIRASSLIAMEGRNGVRMGLQEIADRTGSPKAFTAKVLQQLVHAGILVSVKGPHGGFDLPPGRAMRVTLADIVQAMDGDTVYRGCGMGLTTCNARKPCPLHDQFQKIRDDLRRMLETTDLHELSLGLKEGLTYLKR
jgi:Rrf2 family transcriptional regulator, iron-sulfur cluster assembly transcription factor